MGHARHERPCPMVLVGRLSAGVNEPRLMEIPANAEHWAIAQGWCVVVRSDLFDGPSIDPAQSNPHRTDTGDD